MNVPVTVDGLDGVSAAAVHLLQSLLQQFADDVAAEASRIEEGERLRQTDVPELTATMVEEAYRSVKRARTPLRTGITRQEQLITAAVSVSGVLTGAMLTLLHSMWQVALATAAAVIFLLGSSVQMWWRK